MPRRERGKRAWLRRRRQKLRALRMQSWTCVLSAQVLMQQFANSREKPKRPNGPAIAPTRLPASVASAATTTGTMEIAELVVWKRKTAEQSAHRARKEALSWRVRADLSCCIAWKPSKSLRFASHQKTVRWTRADCHSFG